jgi:hypothetical protein
MALESKPIFHPEVLRQQVRSFNLPEQTAAWQPKLQEWPPLIASGRTDDFKETALLPDFLTDIFCGLLGYTGPVGPADTHNSHNSHNSHLSDTGPAESPDTFTFSRERHVEVHGKVADAVLGRFQKDKAQFVMGPMLFRFTIIWESMIVIIRENRAEVIEIIWERVEPRAA